MRNYLSLLGNIYRSKYINHNALVSNANYASLSAPNKKFIMRIKNAISDGDVDFSKIPSLDNYSCKATYEELYANMFPNEGIKCSFCKASYPERVMTPYTDIAYPAADEEENTTVKDRSKFAKYYICPICLYLYHLDDIGECHICHKKVSKSATFSLCQPHKISHLCKNEEVFYENFPKANEKQFQICQLLSSSYNKCVCSECLEKASFAKEEFIRYGYQFCKFTLKGKTLDFGPITRNNINGKKIQYDFGNILKEMVEYYEPDVKGAKKNKFDGSFTYFNMPDPLKAISGGQFKDRRSKLNILNSLFTEFYYDVTGNLLRYEADKGCIIDASESNTVFEVSKGMADNSLSAVIIFENIKRKKEKEIKNILKRFFNNKIKCPWNNNDVWVYYEKPSYANKSKLYYDVLRNRVPVCLCEVHLDLQNIDVTNDDEDGNTTITVDFVVNVTNQKVGNVIEERHGYTTGYEPFRLK